MSMNFSSSSFHISQYFYDFISTRNNKIILFNILTIILCFMFNTFVVVKIFSDKISFLQKI